MKYVWILVAVVIIVRIDLILRFFDKTSENYQSSQSPEVRPSDIEPSVDLVPVNKDLALKATPRKVFFSILNDFKSIPDQSIKDKAIEVLKNNPTLFDEKRDAELEAAIFQMKAFLLQKDKVTQSLIMELMKSLKGENLEMIKSFFSYAIDIDVADFLSVYSKSGDTNCLLMAYLGDRLPDVEKYNELSERLIALDTFIASETSVPLRPYAQRCQMVLKLQIEKLKAIVIPFEDPAAPAEETPTVQPPVSPEPTTAPGATP